jgi:hypothetical protein
MIFDMHALTLMFCSTPKNNNGVMRLDPCNVRNKGEEEDGSGAQA